VHFFAADCCVAAGETRRVFRAMAEIWSGIVQVSSGQFETPLPRAKWCCGAATHGAKISLDAVSLGWVIGQ
jgi:hypothetical protein